MMKYYWNSLILDGSISPGEIERMMDNFFKLMVSKMIKQDQQSTLAHFLNSVIATVCVKTFDHLF